jgi:hypothetical protein
LRDLALNAKDPVRSRALILLGCLGDRNMRTSLQPLAASDGELQEAALLALNGIGFESQFARLSDPGLKNWELKGTVESVMEELFSICDLKSVISDRVAKDSLGAAYEFKGVRSVHELLAELSRRAQVGYIFERNLIRVVPIQEAIAHHSK